jgi:hypothetical protein
LQSTTYITIEHYSGSSTAISNCSLAKMSATPGMPKVAPTLPSGPRPGGASSPSKEEILADLRRQVSSHFPLPRPSLNMSYPLISRL